MTGPDPNKVYPNENIRQVVFIKNVVKRANIVVGDYTYYDDPDGAEKFEEHVIFWATGWLSESSARLRVESSS